MRTSIDVFAKAREHERLEQLRAARELDALPYFRVLEGPTLPVVEMEGKRRIMLGSNNYLGLTGDERVRQGALDALDRYGTGLTGSRFLNGTIDLHLELERELAEWLGTESALVFTTGHQANLGALGTILGPGDTVIADSGDHASILDGCILSRAKLRAFRHNRLDRLERTLEKAAGDGGGILVVVDGVFSMEGDVAPLPEIVELCERFGARLMVDEAHALGVLGARGGGTSELLGVEDRVDLRMATFSKSLASCGGVIAGPADVIEFLRIQSRPFMFTASAVPAAVGAALAAVRICRSPEGPELFAQVLSNARYLHAGLSELGFEVVEPTRLADSVEIVTPVVPVVVGDDWKAALLWEGALRRRGVRQRGASPRRSPGRRAAAHQRDGDPRSRDPRRGPRGVRAGQGLVRGRARPAPRASVDALSARLEPRGTDHRVHFCGVRRSHPLVHSCTRGRLEKNPL